MSEISVQRQLRDEFDKIIWRYTEESDLMVSDIVFVLECVKFDFMDKVKGSRNTPHEN